MCTGTAPDVLDKLGIGHIKVSLDSSYVFLLCTYNIHVRTITTICIKRLLIKDCSHLRTYMYVELLVTQTLEATDTVCNNLTTECTSYCINLQS